MNSWQPCAIYHDFDHDGHVKEVIEKKERKVETIMASGTFVYLAYSLSNESKVVVMWFGIF